MEVQSKSGPADISKMRANVGALNLGEAQLQQFGAATDVLIRIPQQPGGEVAQQEAAQKVRAALGDNIEVRRIEVVGPRVSTELLAYGIFGLLFAICGIFVYLWFRFEWQFALGAMIANPEVAAAVTATPLSPTRLWELLHPALEGRCRALPQRDDLLLNGR